MSTRYDLLHRPSTAIAINTRSSLLSAAAARHRRKSARWRGDSVSPVTSDVQLAAGGPQATAVMTSEVPRPLTRQKTSVGESGMRRPGLGEREKTTIGTEGAASAPTSTRHRAPLSQNAEPTFYIGGGNGVAIIEQVLTEMGWKRTREKQDENFRLKWTESKGAINYNAFREGEQMVNHIPNCNLLTNKMGLLTTLQEFDRVALSVKKRSSGLDFIPETYRLDSAKDREAFFSTYKEGEVWICKPTGLNQGKGIYLVKTPGEVEQLRESKGANRIIQRYLASPLLLEGRKFDIRCYMLIASTVPYLILYHQGYCRLSLYGYDTKSDNIIAHLTNQFIQKKDPTYQDVKENTAWSMDKLNEYINNNVAPNKGLDRDWVHTALPARIKQIMMHCFNAVKNKLQCKVGYFELYGFDFLIDSDMKIWLIEVNINPCLAINCEALRERVPGVVKETIHIAVECFDKIKKGKPILPVQAMKDFELLFIGNNTKSTPGHNPITLSNSMRQSTFVRSSPSAAPAASSPAAAAATGDPVTRRDRERVEREREKSVSVSPARRTRSLSPAKKDVVEPRPRPPLHIPHHIVPMKPVVLSMTREEQRVPTAVATDLGNLDSGDIRQRGRSAGFRLELGDESGAGNDNALEKSGLSPIIASMLSGRLPIIAPTTLPVPMYTTATSAKLRSARRSPHAESLTLKMTHVQPGLGLMMRRESQRSSFETVEKINRGS